MALKSKDRSWIKAEQRKPDVQKPMEPEGLLREDSISITVSYASNLKIRGKILSLGIFDQGKDRELLAALRSLVGIKFTSAENLKKSEFLQALKSIVNFLPLDSEITIAAKEILKNLKQDDKVAY